MKLTRSCWMVGWCLLATACTPFHSDDVPSDGGDELDAGVDAPGPQPDTGAHDATIGGHDSGTAGDAKSVVPDATSPGDGSITIDTVCASPWSEMLCEGHTVSSIGNIQFSDDPRIGFARSLGGTLGVCYASDDEDFLTRQLDAITFSVTSTGATEFTKAITLFTSSEADTTPVCGIGGGDGSTFHVLVYDTENEVLDYGELIGMGTPAYETFGPASVEGYLTLGVVNLDPTHLLAAVGNASTGNIQSYVVTPFDGGATFASPVTALSGIGISVDGAGQFSLRAGATPAMLVDVQPADAGGSRADLATYEGASWNVATVEGNGVDATVGYSPSLAVADGGLRGVYFERNFGTTDAGTSQLHIATIEGLHIDVATPVAATADNDPDNPLVGVAAAVGPDGRLFVAYVASPSAGEVVLYLARPESTVPGAPFIVDTIDDKLSAADPPSVNLIVEPSGRVDIVYMRMLANTVYFATRDP